MASLYHEGFCSLRLTTAERVLRVDPLSRPEPGQVVVLNKADFERVDATARAARAGERPTVVGLQPMLFWLQGLGKVEAHLAPATVGGFTLDQMPYTPIPYVAGQEWLWKGLSTLKRPGRTAHRLVRRLELPDVSPAILHAVLPDGRRFLHLDLSLHCQTPPAWLERVCQRFGEPDVLLVGVDAKEEDAISELLPMFRAKRAWVADLVGDVRRRLGLPGAHPERVAAATGASLLPPNTTVPLD